MMGVSFYIKVPSHEQHRHFPTAPDRLEMSGIVRKCFGNCRDIENIQKIPVSEILFKHRHMTPCWKSLGLSIKEMTILGHFDLFGPRNGWKRV